MCCQKGVEKWLLHFEGDLIISKFVKPKDMTGVLLLKIHLHVLASKRYWIFEIRLQQWIRVDDHTVHLMECLRDIMSSKRAYCNNHSQSTYLSANMWRKCLITLVIFHIQHQDQTNDISPAIMILPRKYLQSSMSSCFIYKPIALEGVLTLSAVLPYPVSAFRHTFRLSVIKDAAAQWRIEKVDA